MGINQGLRPLADLRHWLNILDPSHAARPVLHLDPSWPRLQCTRYQSSDHPPYDPVYRWPVAYFLPGREMEREVSAWPSCSDLEAAIHNLSIRSRHEHGQQMGLFRRAGAVAWFSDW